jgi:ElaB/YqjD/DUF883 family membrane-anchored ribosome-binding protein
MRRTSELLAIPASFLDNIEMLLRAAARTAKDKADRASAKQIIERTRKRPVEVLDEKGLRRMAAKKKAARKKAR